MTTVTQWFSGKTKPVNIGPYENATTNVYQFWNGEFWGYVSLTPEVAAEHKNSKSAYQNERWRGLAAKPKSGIKTRSPKAK